MNILETAHLSAGYGNDPVIKNISFSLIKGEFVTVLGRNGSGKSTLIKALQGLLRHTSGYVRIDGQEISSLKPRQIAQKISYVPQMSDLSFEFNVEEIISMGRYVHQKKMEGLSSEDEKIIQDVMELTETLQLRENPLAHLSGGERQRVFIARALAQDAPLLLLDEPSSHLDINYQVEIYSLLQRLQKEKKKTILAAEHNINLVIPYSQRLMFIKEGQIFRQGPPEELITKSNIEEVFRADVDIRENLSSGLPEISLIPSDKKNS
jgi:iron complex transport system ATP-binding protein